LKDVLACENSGFLPESCNSFGTEGVQDMSGIVQSAEFAKKSEFVIYRLEAVAGMDSLLCER
jgi:hypothetical protein